MKTLSAETVKLSASNNIFSQIGTHPNLFRFAKCRKYAKSQINKADDSGYPYIVCFICVGYELSSRLVSKQVLSPLQSLTSVFGMGTGGPFAFETLTLKQVLPRLLFDPFGSLISSPSCDAASISPNIFAWLRQLAGGAPSGIRTRDPLIKSQLLYQLS